MPLLELKHLQKNFSSQKAVKDISLQIEQGQIFGLLGPNGAGKTTLIRMITGIFYPDAGEIFLDGQKFDPLNDITKIGYMPEERGLYKKMKVGEQALYLAQLKGLNKIEATRKIRDWFARFDMDSWWNKKVEDLSKGMSQKLQFVILDEPFSGLDPVNANLIKDEIFNLAQKGSTIIFSTHRMEQVEEICDHIALINKGEKILDGTVKQIKQDFKEQLYRIDFENQLLAEHLAIHLFEVIKTGNNHAILKVDPSYSNNDILQYFIHKNMKISSFNEILPSLNDIFIKLVEGTPTARQFNG